MRSGNRGRERKTQIPCLVQRIAFPFIAARALTKDYAPLRPRV